MNNVALITGASSGIGKELSYIHAEKGGDLVIVARRKNALEEIKKDIENKHAVSVKIIPKDLTDLNAPKEIYEELKKDEIQVEYLINNAGFGGWGKFHEREWEKDDAMIKVNIMALTAITRFFLPDFVKRNSGRILNVSSIASFMPGPLQAVYYATKAYVSSFSNALSEELHDTNVTVTSLMPGATKTEFAQVSGMDKTKMFDKFFTAGKVAEAGYNAMMKGKIDKITGITFSQRLMLPMIPFLPKKMKLKTIRKMQEVD
jgi:uncharacterized protein